MLNKYYSIRMEPATILLADDNLVLGLFVKRVLQQAGYRVWFCMDIAEAWQYYADKKPDLVLLDSNNQESEMNFKLAKKIRRENKIIPILFLSGRTFEEELYNSMEQSQQEETKRFPSEKNLLQHLHGMLPADKRTYNHVSGYNPKNMQLCTPEDILILTTFFEKSIHLRQYIPN
jgi:CheY-like chemotaxis protein